METIDENRVRDITREELANFTPQKKKRAPNKWQIFLKECAREQDKELPYTDKVKVCSIKYKENKNKNSNDPSPEQPVQPVQHIQSTQPIPPVQYTQPVQPTQPTLSEDDIERLIRLNNEKLAKMVKRQ